MKKFVFLLGALAFVTVGTAQNQRTKNADKKATTTTTTSGNTTVRESRQTTVGHDAPGSNGLNSSNTSDIITPVGAKVNATDGQTEPPTTGMGTDPDILNNTDKTNNADNRSGNAPAVGTNRSTVTPNHGVNRSDNAPAVGTNRSSSQTTTSDGTTTTTTGTTPSGTPVEETTTTGSKKTTTKGTTTTPRP
jgi:hypothetical protein